MLAGRTAPADRVTATQSIVSLAVGTPLFTIITQQQPALPDVDQGLGMQVSDLEERFGLRAHTVPAIYGKPSGRVYICLANSRESLLSTTYDRQQLQVSPAMTQRAQFNYYHAGCE